MNLFTLFAILISVTAILSYLNARFLRLPPTIGVMASALCLSVVLTVCGRLGWMVDRWAESLMQQVDFSAVLLQGMLSFLLFAGSLHVDLGTLLERKWSILALATVGVALSTFLIGTLFFSLLILFGLHVDYIWCLLFGALISPTDPIAVIGMLKHAGLSQTLRSMIVGESLFNDGVGVVVFSLILGIAAGGYDLSAAGVGLLFLEEAVGGALLGLLLGWIAYLMLRTLDNHMVEILITLALVAGGYALAGALHTSGPIAMVAAGLLIGNHGRLFGMSERTRGHLDNFWALIDEILNAMLFVMIGLELLILDLRGIYLLVGLAVIPIMLVVRFTAVGLPISSLRFFRTFPHRTVHLMTWAGVRGGISIALALSLPPFPQRDLILVVTYALVVFSILVQGLTVGRVARALWSRDLPWAVSLAR
jgi:CPA1 family monovalent cation:H+ antiporter